MKKLLKKAKKGTLTMSHPGGIVSEHFRLKKQKAWVKKHKDISI